MEEIKNETVASEEIVASEEATSKGKKTKIPPAAIAYMISGLWSIVSVFMSFSTIDTLATAALSLIPSLAVTAIIVFCIIKNKKNIGLFFLYVLSSGGLLLALATSFNVGTLLSCMGTILLMLIVGTVTVPPLEKFKAVAKKIYFLPSLLILLSAVVTNLLVTGSLEYILLGSPVYTFVNFFMSPVVTLLFASWCLKSQDELSGKNKKDKIILIIFIVFLVVSLVASIAMDLTNGDSSSSSSSSSSSESYDDSSYDSSSSYDDSSYGSSSSSGSYGGSSYGSSSSSGSYGSSYGSSSSSGSYGGSSYGSSSSSDKQYGAGGYEMPNENDDSFADYVQRVDPELYDAMEDRYNAAVDDYNSSSNSGSGGFVGSDGEYHAYVPEFGDDVNDWMADNW